MTAGRNRSQASRGLTVADQQQLPGFPFFRFGKRPPDLPKPRRRTWGRRPWTREGAIAYCRGVVALCDAALERLACGKDRRPH